MTQITDSMNKVTKICSAIEAFVKDTLASSLCLFNFLKAHNSLNSLTKALMTAMPEKLSCEKSEREEKAA